MKIIPILSVLFLILLSGPTFAEKLAVFPALVHPAEFHMTKEHIYFTDGYKLLIYSQKDFRLITKYGQRGEGPGEFMLVGGNQLMLSIEPGNLIVNSYGRITRFTKNGVYLNEKKIKTVAKLLLPVGKQWVGLKYKRENKILYHYIKIYDSAFNVVKTIHKHKHGLQIGSNIHFNPLTVSPPAFKVYKNRIFLLDGARETLMVFDSKGELLFSLTDKSPPPPFTTAQKEKYLNQLLLDSFWKRLYKTKKHLFRFPSNYPPIDWFFIDRALGTIYLSTNHKKDGKQKYLVFGQDGQFIKTVHLPTCDGFQCLVTFFDEGFYRLKDNENQEVWELHVKGIED